MKKPTGEQIFEKEKVLSQYQGTDRVVASTELLEELKNTEKEIFLVPTSIPTLDRLQGGGFEAGELVVLTGLGGEGKTSLMMTITKNVASKGFQSVWFTLEVTPRQFMKKIAMHENLPLFYLPREITDNQLEWIEERILEAKAKYNTRVVFIDHIQQIYSLEKMRGMNISIEIGDLVGKIKNIALLHNMVIFLVAHCKDDPNASDKEPTMFSIRDSGLINRLADSVISVWRVPNDHEISKTRRKNVEEGDDTAKVRLWKNRREGKLGSWLMKHKNHYLMELTADDEFDNF